MNYITYNYALDALVAAMDKNIDDFNKNVFLTQDEAYAKLEKLKGEIIEERD